MWRWVIGIVPLKSATAIPLPIIAARPNMRARSILSVSRAWAMWRYRTLSLTLRVSLGLSWSDEICGDLPLGSVTPARDARGIAGGEQSGPRWRWCPGGCHGKIAQTYQTWGPLS